MCWISFDHCVIHMSNWYRSMEFYRDVLEAEVVPYGDGFYSNPQTTRLSLRLNQEVIYRSTTASFRCSETLPSMTHSFLKHLLEVGSAIPSLALG